MVNIECLVGGLVEEQPENVNPVTGETSTLRSFTCERLLALAHRVERGDDIAQMLAAETQRIRMFTALELDEEFAQVRQVQETMRRSLNLYLEGCSFLQQRLPGAARKLFLEADLVMQEAEAGVEEEKRDRADVGVA